MIVRLALSILGLLLIAACNGSSPLAAQTSTVVPMNVQTWAILYSPGMPPHPTPQIGGGWYFDFSTDPNSVHYVLAAVSMAASLCSSRRDQPAVPYPARPAARLGSTLASTCAASRSYAHREDAFRCFMDAELDVLAINT